MSNGAMFKGSNIANHWRKFGQWPSRTSSEYVFVSSNNTLDH